MRNSSLESANNHHTNKVAVELFIEGAKLTAVVPALITLLAVEVLKATILSYGVVSVSFPAWDLGLDSRQGDLLSKMFCTL